jgi:hypothetical protein
MSTLTQRIILFAIAVIEYAIAWDPAPTSTVLQAIGAKAAAARTDVESRTADLGGALGEATK